MKTAFFPYTFLSAPTFAALKTLFGTLTVYAPLVDAVPERMKKWEAEHQLDLCFPVSGHEAELHRALKAYRQWAGTHTLSQWAFLRFQDAQASLSNDAHIYQIRDEIMHRVRRKTSDPEIDPLLTARLFLVLAQEYDRQQMEIADDWAQLGKMESTLFDTLKGDIPPATAEEGRMPVELDASASDMMAQRLRAWSRLMRQDDAPPVILATTSREAFGRIVDDNPAADLIPGFDAAPFPLPPELETVEASRQLMIYLNSVAASEWSVEHVQRFDMPKDEDLPRVALTVAIVPDIPAGAVFSRYSGNTSLAKAGVSSRHTLLALVER